VQFSTFKRAKRLSIAYGVAVVQEIWIVATGIHADDNYLYPDYPPQFVEAFEATRLRSSSSRRENS
jgi:7-cyano-7-deazaguanine synthase in queuosine biosynthesis